MYFHQQHAFDSDKILNNVNERYHDVITTNDCDVISYDRYLVGHLNVREGAPVSGDGQSKRLRCSYWFCHDYRTGLKLEVKADGQGHEISEQYNRHDVIRMIPKASNTFIS